MPPRRPRNLRTTAKSSLADWDDVPPNNNNDNNSDSKQKSVSPKDATPEQPAVLQADSSNEPTKAQQQQDMSTKIDIDGLRELQRLKRQRQRGLDIHMLGKTSSRNKTPTNPDSKADNNNNNNNNNISVDDSQNGSQTSRSLSSAFTAQTNKLDADKYMMEYIENEMKRYRGSDDPQTPMSKVPDADDLYQIPDHLRVVEQKPLNEGNVAMAAKMLTSIQEVDLGRDAKIRNIRETDRAVSMLAKSSSSARDPALSDIPSRGSGPPRTKRHADHPDRSSKATDDVVLQRFKKRMRR
ncbi:hypothetical protein J3B02_006495 [Coemansia erecta]|nr:hypothetical protein J3B02_006495 [Coemansia erecta]KAJ2853384.1 hypothetical protein FB639_006549 [Coemansia asiatica]